MSNKPVKSNFVKFLDNKKCIRCKGPIRDRLGAFCTDECRSGKKDAPIQTGDSPGAQQAQEVPTAFTGGCSARRRCGPKCPHMGRELRRLYKDLDEAIHNLVEVSGAEYTLDRQYELYHERGPREPYDPTPEISFRGPGLPEEVAVLSDASPPPFRILGGYYDEEPVLDLNFGKIRTAVQEARILIPRGRVKTLINHYEKLIEKHNS